jgi:pimeloyl-ACP methyl ester carboxylesterase
MYKGKTLFIKGEKSDYIDYSNSKVLINFFPNHKIVEVLNAGHWVHAENLNDFIKEIEIFLKS